jgi:hypothetical protein
VARRLVSERRLIESRMATSLLIGALGGRQSPRCHGWARRIAPPAVFLCVLAFACDEANVGLPFDRLKDSDTIQVWSREGAVVCNTISTREGRERVETVLRNYPDWPVLEECRTPICRNVLARWKRDDAIVAEVGVCGDWVTVQIPGPQGCGRLAPEDQAKELLVALGATTTEQSESKRRDPTR